MSRTHHHGPKSPKKRIKWDEANPPKKRRHQVHPWTFWEHTPSYWIHQMMTRPQRAAVRGLIAKLHRIQDLEDAPLFPLTKKPHIYFW